MVKIINFQAAVDIDLRSTFKPPGVDAPPRHARSCVRQQEKLCNARAIAELATNVILKIGIEKCSELIEFVISFEIVALAGFSVGPKLRFESVQNPSFGFSDQNNF